MEDQDLPPQHFGDYPHGANRSAERRPSTDEDEPVDHTISGPVIGVMWDYGVRMPLWDPEGLLPEEPEWLREALGLSDPLINDLRQWGLLAAVPGRPVRHDPQHGRLMPGRGLILDWKRDGRQREALVAWFDDAALRPLVKMEWLPIEQLVPVAVDPNLADWAAGSVLGRNRGLPPLLAAL